jgi:hypothetical protein
MTRHAACAMLVGLMTLTAVPREVSAQGWTLLGSRTVTDRVDHDTIVVSAARGDFTGVKLAVGGSAVQFYRVVVHFANGGAQELEMRSLIRAGGETRVIDLRGDERFIRSIDFWYEARSLGPKGAVVRAFGRR